MKTAAVLAIVLALASATRAIAGASDDAMSAALAWLKLVDSSKYAESGRQSSAVFQKSVTPEKWESMLILGRAPLGKLATRAEKSRKHATSLNSAPDGEYYIIQFNSSFEKKQEARETVTMLLESDGQWRVAGYFIQ